MGPRPASRRQRFESNPVPLGFAASLVDPLPFLAVGLRAPTAHRMIAACASSAALHRRFCSLSPSTGGPAARKFQSRKLCRCVAGAAPLLPRLHPAGALASPHVALQTRPSGPRSNASSTRLRGVADSVEAGVAAWAELPLVIQGSIRLVRWESVPVTHITASHAPCGELQPCATICTCGIRRKLRRPCHYVYMAKAHCVTPACRSR